MTQECFFKDAKWVGASDRSVDCFSVLRGRFWVENFKKVTLHILGLGFFKCYINGVCINPDTFLPLSSEYEVSATRNPEGEILSGHRIYVPDFDISPFLRVGENVIAVQYGGGWYTCPWRVFGLPKAIYCITVEEETTRYYVSDENCRIGKGLVESYEFVKCEHQSYDEWQDCFCADFDDHTWEHAVVVEALDTEYCQTDCPRDALIEELPLTQIGKGECGIVYDCGRNTVGYPVLELHAKKGERVEVRFSEDLTSDGKIDPKHAHGQVFSVLSDGTVRLVQPEFTWYGFRYVEVIGQALPKFVKVVHADVAVSSSFESDNETLNWIYKTFVHTMLCNMHTGHPSDCPHIERRGYTGDGQLTCHAALSVLDARAFYEKWLQDIADGQDILSGHIQYTAPYIRSGGGPGGWGCAIVEVPYQLYKHYGDVRILSKYYGCMRRYIDYLEAHSEFCLVTSDKEEEWCLGDWCGPIILYPEKDIAHNNKQMMIPPPMVNTYFMVKALRTMCKIARLIGKDEDVAEYERKAEERARAIQAAYFNAFDGNFVMNVQGANAYAVDLGLGNERTYSNMRSYYQKLGYYDTGIFATDILTRVLFERGDAELAIELLVQDGEQGFERWRRNGATTFHEYWNSNRSRSHNHPMFGAPVAYFFEFLLGIRQKPDSAGYSSLVIEPQAVAKFGFMRGKMQTPQGEISVEYQKENGKTRFEIKVPQNTDAVLKYGGNEYALLEGENTFLL
ncbi:MAG: family 78 glycoside hydrolase catalytic domain [Clostridia bacterium]|nr:family 78 glycoside hydrolase catalytic domain [Clostridia bacterium]MBQ9785718.1 family 78 glycoside hydrolase catalytic domain [Clostridia bacterium]